jgi:4'-phosphopantetheinyl transferase
LLSADERERAARFCFDKHRRRFTAGRGILRTLLGRYLERNPRELTFEYSDHGKPFLAGTPVPELRFNLSHSHEVALFAFTSGRDVGVDVEQIRPDRSTREIAERFFSPREARALFALPPEQQTAGFFRCWTRKEAYIKAKGKGMSIPLDSFAVSLSPDEPAQLLWVKDNPAEPRRWTLTTLSPDPTFAACLAADNQPTQFQHWSWDH